MAPPDSVKLAGLLFGDPVGPHPFVPEVSAALFADADADADADLARPVRRLARRYFGEYPDDDGDGPDTRALAARYFGGDD